MSTDVPPKKPKYGMWEPCEVEGCDGEREVMAVDLNQHKIKAPCLECRKRRQLAAHNVPTKAD